jgi:hypothetical protein
MEARSGGMSGMIAVGRNIKTRYESGKYPKNICSIVHQRHQYAPGVRNGYAKEAKSWSQAMAAARKAMKMRGNGFLGFRTSKKKCRGAKIGGNCYTKTATNSDGSDKDGTYRPDLSPPDSDSAKPAPPTQQASGEDETPTV